MSASEESERLRQFTRRTFLLGGIKAGLFLTLLGRLYYLQVLKSDRYVTLAEDNRISLRLIPPSRGQIADRQGNPLATNVPNFRVHLSAEYREKVIPVLHRLSQLVPLSEEDVRRILKDLAKTPRLGFLTIRENLTWDQVSAIELNTPDLPGVSIERGESRSYPLGPAAAHVIGYMGTPTEDEVGDDPVLALPDFKIGKIGLEREYDQELQGTAGNQQLEVNAVGRVVRELSHTESQRGSQITSTLDQELQKLAYTRLMEHDSAAAALMDVHTGEVYALANSPSYDPNIFSQGISTEMWKALINDPKTPLNNKAITGQYAPGSTFKPIAALAALEANLVTEDEHIFCPGYLTLGNHPFHCWRPEGHGSINLRGAIQQSCDVFFYEMGRRLGLDRLMAAAQQLGLGQSTDIDIPGEKTGFLPSEKWKRATFKQGWQLGETLITAIGQGYTLATPLQLAVMISRLVNGGRAVQPSLVKNTTDHKDTTLALEANWPPLNFNPRHLNIVRQGMAAVTMPGGTAYASRIPNPGLEMGGKTGTSQVRRISMAERAQRVLKNEELPWQARDHALFVGFAPVNNPRFACAVVVEHGGNGSHTAAPIARDLLLECQKRYSAQT